MIIFVFIRYIVYGIQIIRGILIAKFLGPYFLGLYGFLLLVLQYLSYLHLGTPYALTVKLAANNSFVPKSNQLIISSSLVITLFVSILLLFLACIIHFFEINIFEKYYFIKYVIIITSIATFWNFQLVFSNIYRIYGYLKLIAIVELINVVLPLTVVFLFKDQELLDAILLATILAGALSTLLFIIKCPVQLSLKSGKIAIKEILSIGIPLLIFNISSYLLMVSGRTVVSLFYSVEIFGYYSFASSIITAIMLGLDAIIWAFYPTILSKLKEELTDNEAAILTQNITELYSLVVFLTVFFTILILPIVFLYLSEFKPVHSVLNVLLLTQAVFSINFGYTSLAVARNKHKQIAIRGILSVVIVVTLSLLVVYLKLNFFWIAVATFISSFFFTIFQVQFARKLINNKNNVFKFITNVFKLELLIPLILFFLSALLEELILLQAIGMFTFIILNWEKILAVLKLIMKNLSNNNNSLIKLDK